MYMSCYILQIKEEKSIFALVSASKWQLGPKGVALAE